MTTKQTSATFARRGRARGPRWKWIALAAAGAMGQVHLRLARADEGPALVAERPSLEPFYLAPPTTWLDFEYFRDDETQKTHGVASSHFTENRFQELLTMQTTGYVLHPNLVDLKLQGSFGLEQDLLSESGKNNTVDGILYDWDADATLFRKEEMPVTIYSRRNTSYYSQPFGPSLESTLMTEGTVLDWQNKTVPTRVEYYHLTQEQRALDGSQDYNEAQDTLTWHSNYQPTQQNHSTFDYAFNSGVGVTTATDYGGQTTNDFTNNTLSLTNELDFGPHDKSNLQSALLYYSETGTYQLSELRYTEILHLQHTDDLATNFRYLLDKESAGGGFGGVTTDQLLQRGDIQVQHQLYKSLITTADVGVQTLSVNPSGDETEWFGTLDVDYTKVVPYGKLTVNAGMGFDQTENSGSSDITHVVNQQRTFNGALPLTVTGNNIIANSLVITDAAGIRIYRPNLDYVVRAFPDFLQIERVLGGNIPDGQAVLLSYDLAAQPGNTLRTTSVSLGARYDFDSGYFQGVGVYGRYLDQSQSVSSSAAESFTPNSVVDKLVGLDYRVWEIKFLAEQEWRHSTLSPYDQTRFDLRWVHPISSTASLTVEPTYLMAYYPETNDRLNTFSVIASAQVRLSAELSVNGSVIWDDQRDRLFGDTRALQEEVDIQWAHGQTSAYLQFRNSDVQSGIQDNAYQTLQIGIRRTF